MNDGIVHRAKVESTGTSVLDDSPSLRFPWWSVTKTVLTACTLRLVARGRLTLDDALPGRAYTLRQVLQHRAGVRNYGGLAGYQMAVDRNDDPWTADDLLERLDADRLDFAPDQGWAYFNTGYLVVRRIVEETTGAALIRTQNELDDSLLNAIDRKE